ARRALARGRPGRAASHRALPARRARRRRRARLRWHDPALPQRGRGGQRRRAADPARRRAGRRGDALRLPHGHLPQLRRQAALGAGARPAHRPRARPGRGDAPHVHQRARGRDRDRPLSMRVRSDRFHFSINSINKKDTNMSATLEPPQTIEPTLPHVEEANGAESPLKRLSAEQLEHLGREFDAIHDDIFAELGERDARYIRNTIRLHRQLVLASRLLLLGSRRRELWVLGTAALSLAKILENMEIGHNVMHGQWDWMNDPDINSQNWDWDTASPADAWRHSHNYEHHTFTNIRGKDRDLGYEIMRIDPHQKWHPIYVFQPLYNLILMGFFEWGVALHDMNFDAIRSGEKSKRQAGEELKAIGLKARRQIVKDYIAFPALSAAVNAAVAGARGGRRGEASRSARATFKSTLTANFTSNI